MPPYPWLARNLTDYESLPARMTALSKIGVPYSTDEITAAVTHARNQAAEIAAKLRSEGEEVAADSELIAMIAYLQRLGTDWAGSPDNPVSKTTAGGAP
jgi:cytochrome c oxidase cbb3-type subunit I/II